MKKLQEFRVTFRIVKSVKFPFNSEVIWRKISHQIRTHYFALFNPHNNKISQSQCHYGWQMKNLISSKHDNINLIAYPWHLYSIKPLDLFEKLLYVAAYSLFGVSLKPQRLLKNFLRRKVSAIKFQIKIISSVITTDIRTNITPTWWW